MRIGPIYIRLSFTLTWQRKGHPARWIWPTRGMVTRQTVRKTIAMQELKAKAEKYL